MWTLTPTSNLWSDPGEKKPPRWKIWSDSDERNEIIWTFFLCNIPGLTGGTPANFRKFWTPHHPGPIRKGVKIPCTHILFTVRKGQKKTEGHSEKSWTWFGWVGWYWAQSGGKVAAKVQPDRGRSRLVLLFWVKKLILIYLYLLECSTIDYEGVIRDNCCII